MESIVSQLRVAVATRDKPVVFSCLGALTRASLNNNQHLEAYQVGAAPVILDAMDAWPSDVNMLGVGVNTLFHCWGGGLLPFDDTTLTPRAIEATLGAIKYKNLQVDQAALRLLHCHSLSEAKLFALPAVATAVAEAMAVHLDDETVQVWGAETMLQLLGITQKDVIRAHGQYGLAVLNEQAIKAAATTRHGNEVMIEGEAWSQVVLHSIFPRLRRR